MATAHNALCTAMDRRQPGAQGPACAVPVASSRTVAAGTASGRGTAEERCSRRVPALLSTSPAEAQSPASLQHKAPETYNYIFSLV